MKEHSILKSMLLLGVVMGSGMNIGSSFATEGETKASEAAAMPAPPMGPYQSQQENTSSYPPAAQQGPRLHWPSNVHPDWSKPSNSIILTK